MVTYNHYLRHVIGSVGTPVGTVEVQIRDVEGNVLDPEWGERITAFIIPAPGRTVDTAGLKTYLKSNLSSYKVPKEFRMVETLPKSPAGKILKRELRNRFLNQADR